MYMQTSTYQQEPHYYPYGGLMGESTGGDVQRFKYNGKELERMHGRKKSKYRKRKEVICNKERLLEYVPSRTIGKEICLE